MTRMQAHPDLSPYRGNFVHPRLVVGPCPSPEDVPILKAC